MKISKQARREGKELFRDCIVNGALESGDAQFDDGTLVDDYSLALEHGQTVTVVLYPGPSLSTHAATSICATS